jgi:hypothetical protein
MLARIGLSAVSAAADFSNPATLARLVMVFFSEHQPVSS